MLSQHSRATSRVQGQEGFLPAGLSKRSRDPAKDEDGMSHPTRAQGVSSLGGKRQQALQ